MEGEAIAGSMTFGGGDLEGKAIAGGGDPHRTVIHLLPQLSHLLTTHSFHFYQFKLIEKMVYWFVCLQLELCFLRNE